MWESFCISKIGVKASSSGFSGSALRDALLKQLCASLRRQRVGRNINAAPLQFQQKLLGLRHVKADAAQQRLLRENRLKAGRLCQSENRRPLYRRIYRR